jgi:hypothetical protein
MYSQNENKRVLFVLRESKKNDHAVASKLIFSNQLRQLKISYGKITISKITLLKIILKRKETTKKQMLLNYLP